MTNLINLIDLTSLNDSDTEQSITTFFEKARQPIGNVAAVCIYPQFVKLASDIFEETNVKVATVVNFPSGNEPVNDVLHTIEIAIDDGANEIDVVFPYERYLSGDKIYARQFVAACKAVCDEVTLKVILETGALKDNNIIFDASADVLRAGADFIKTSTGKISVGATIEAATAMLTVIKELSPSLNRVVGFKASGGIRDIETAQQYVDLADEIMGEGWVTPATFRIGASRLIDELI